jgi:DNA-binding CsgD family transcriptional regulator
MDLAALGLAEVDGRVYVALVGRPRSSTAELAEECGLSPVAVGRGLARLVQTGLAGRISGHPVRYLAAAPDVVISDLIGKREAELNRARSFVHELMRTHREASRISHPDLAVEVLTNRDDISALARRIQADARVQVRAFDRPPYVDRPGTNFGMQVEKERQGVRHRVIYDRGALAWPGRLEHDIVPSLKAGEQARLRSELPLKLVLSDDRVGIIPFSLAPRGEATAYVIHHSSLLVALAALFEAEWERALPLSEILADRVDVERAGQPNGEAPDEDTRSLLTLLAAGLSDAAIARSLEWSERTTQRRIQRLLHTLGASTRFQASVLAARRGWL